MKRPLSTILRGVVFFNTLDETYKENKNTVKETQLSHN